VRGAGILAYGGPIKTLELPEPEISDPHQLPIAVHATGVANWDHLVRTGSCGGRPVSDPALTAAQVLEGAVASTLAAEHHVWFC
jgi:NADPH:quinone reductase-like Zn-dependent oxidoreductase